ncbi:hypothetical protein GGS20DRAFT_133921 [Poronia punctata]|nr:hypothetical protein GGS20DRAFT_133921 [Poronia punctata]
MAKGKCRIGFRDWVLSIGLLGLTLCGWMGKGRSGSGGIISKGYDTGTEPLRSSHADQRSNHGGIMPRNTGVGAAAVDMKVHKETDDGHVMWCSVNYEHNSTSYTSYSILIILLPVAFESMSESTSDRSCDK